MTTIFLPVHILPPGLSDHIYEADDKKKYTSAIDNMFLLKNVHIFLVRKSSDFCGVKNVGFCTGKKSRHNLKKIAKRGGGCLPLGATRGCWPLRLLELSEIFTNQNETKSSL